MRGLEKEIGAHEPAGAVSAATPSRGRLDSIDLVRGLVMVIMALDHVRDFMHDAFFTPPGGINATDLNQTWPFLFFTRWITHYCAPTFIFLAGTGAFLYGARGKSKGELSWFLFSRGLWLAFLEVTVVRFAWNFGLSPFNEWGPGVLWAIGWSMVGLSVAVWLPTSTVALIGIAIVTFHNFFDNMTAADLHLNPALWLILHRSGMPETLIPAFQIGSLQFPALKIGTGYHLLPWFGVLAAGYGFGALFLLEQSLRRKQLIGLGLGLIVLFIALRYSNVYGDRPSVDPKTQAVNHALPGPWSVQADLPKTIMSFVNCEKYPPSLLYVLMTLGPSILLIGLVEGRTGWLGKFFVTFGRVPLFYYLLHLPLIHLVLIGFDYVRYGFSPALDAGPWNIGGKKLPEGYGYSMLTVYGVWVGVVLFLYPLCWWFARLKQRRKDLWILSYL